MLEKLIAKHCAPALAGIKPANIAACRKANIPDIHQRIQNLNRQLNDKDIYIEILCECRERVLMIVYRKKVLAEHLAKRENYLFLKNYGYDDFHSTEEYLDMLKTRLDCESFPHEIGVFLGYPIYDIYCFINHRDKGCLLIGDWRVYHNAEYAEKLFGRYKACKKAVYQKVAGGKSLAEIFCAA